MTGTEPRPRIVIFTRAYPPAYLTGGPTRSLFSLVESLAADFGFTVITSAVDDPADGPMASVQPDRWTSYGHATTWYGLSRNGSPWRTAALLRRTRPQLVYLNSLFDYRFSVLPLLLARLLWPRTPVLLAPRGELSPGALGLKRRKKRLFLRAFRLLRLHRAVTWHASTWRDQAHIERTFGPGVRTRVATDMQIGISRADLDLPRPPDGDSGACSLVFYARIVPMKNLEAALEAISLVKDDIRLSIAGPIEDPGYWAACTRLISRLDDPDRVRYVGTVQPDQAVSFLSGFDLLVLPTRGENFGHVVLESLAAGTPVIVGRDTPWQRAETAGAGWLCDPASPAQIAELIQRFLALDADGRGRMRQAALRVAGEVLDDPEYLDVNRALFGDLVRGVRA
jgi:glycosyltransferase involved in cell wall biosynthesis